MLGTHLPFDMFPALYIASAGALILLIFRNKWLSHAGMYGLILICGCALAQYHLQMYAVRAEAFGRIAAECGTQKNCAFRGVVAAPPEVKLRTDRSGGAKQYHQRFLLDDVSVRCRGVWVPVDGRVMVVRISETEKLPVGTYDEVEFSGRAVPVSPGGGTLARTSLLMLKGVCAVAYPGAKTAVSVTGRKAGTRLERAIGRVRSRVLAALSAGCSDTDARKLFIGMIIGEQQGMSEAVAEVFRRTNTIHILAISGQQVTLVSFIIIGILSALGISRRPAAIIAMPAIALYAVIVGNEPSVCRAAIMMLVILAGRIISRESDIINSLAFAALVMLAVRPFDLYNIGFQLSFLVVYAIVVLTPAITTACAAVLRMKDDDMSGTLKGKAVAGIAVCVSAWIGSAPLIAYYFGLFSPVSVPANIYTAALVGFIIVPLGFASVVLGQFSLWVAAAFNTISIFFSQLLIAANTLLAKIPYACFQVGEIPLLDVIWYYGVVAAIAHTDTMKKFTFTKKRCIYLLFALCVFVWMKFFGTFSGLEVSFLDVGQGDAIAVKFPNGKYMLVDGGPGYPQAPMCRSLRSYLSSHFVRKIDAAVLTHPHADHIGGLPAVLENVSVGEVITNGSTHPSFLYKKLLEEAEKRDMRYREVKAGDTIDIDPEVTVEVLWPDGTAVQGMDVNDASIVLRIVYGQTSFLLCADAGKGAQARIREAFPGLKADVIKIPHHGAANALDEKFLAVTAPMDAVISVGKNNKFGHPALAVLDFLASKGIKIYRTDLDGTITVQAGKRGYKIKTSK